MSNIIEAKVTGKLPAIFKGLDVLATSKEMTGGTTSGLPVISYRGKVWRVKKSGEEQAYLDQNGDPVPSIEVVLVKSVPHMSKIFYEKKYSDGDSGPPRCWSSNGKTPDAEVENAISPTCAACPNNVWGSRTSDAGKKGRLCADSRRVAVVMAHEMEENGAEAEPLLLRIPAASLNPLKDYIEKVLQPKGVPFCALVTRIGFDSEQAHPQLTFRGARFLTDEEAQAVMKLRESDSVNRILNDQDAPNDATGTTAAKAQVSASAAEDEDDSPAAAPVAPKSKATKKAQPRPAVEAEVGIEEAPVAAVPAKPAKPAVDPKAAKAAALRAQLAALEAAEDEEGKEEPAPAPAPVAAAKAPAKVAAAKPAVAAAAAGDFDSMLDSILG